MYKGEIIDTHMHLWDLKNNYEWLSTKLPEFEQLIGNYDKLRQNFLVEDYKELIKNQNIIKAIHVQAFGFPDNPIGETRWLQEQADTSGFPNGIVAFANLYDPHVEKILEQHAKFSNVCGIRMPLNYHNIPYLRMTDRGDYLSDAQWQTGFALLANYNFSFDVQIYDHQIDDVVLLAKKFPNIVMIIEHFAWPIDLSKSGFEVWKKRIASLVKFPNIYMKLSGIGCVFQKLNIESINDYIKTAVKLFGVERCMFGSNCPPDTLFYDFDQLIATYKTAFASFSNEEQHKIFCLNAKKIYRL